MLKRTPSAFTALICAALLPMATWATPPAAMVAGTGEASVRVMPTKIRMQVQVEAHGKTTELAFQRLKARQESVADDLCALGAAKQSINFGDPSVNKASSTGYSYGSPGTWLPAVPGYGTPTPAPGYFPPAAPTYGPLAPVPPPSAVPPAIVAPGSAESSLEPIPDAGPGPAVLEPNARPHAASRPTAPSSSGATLAPVSPVLVPSSTVPAPALTYSPPTARPESSAIASAEPRRGLPGPQGLITATATLTVEWPLKVETVEQAVLAGEALRKKLLAAGDLMRGKAAEKLPPDEQELLDEQPAPNTTSQVVQRQVPVQETLPDGRSVTRIVQEEVVTASAGLFTAPPSTLLASTPLLYVATISSPQRKALLAEAFGNAKSQAAELAEAGGGKLGAISSMSADVSNSKPGERIFDVSPPTSLPFFPAPNENSNEATAANPGGLKFYVKVRALFLLK